MIAPKSRTRHGRSLLSHSSDGHAYRAQGIVVGRRRLARHATRIALTFSGREHDHVIPTRRRVRRRIQRAVLGYTYCAPVCVAACDGAGAVFSAAAFFTGALFFAAFLTAAFFAGFFAAAFSCCALAALTASREAPAAARPANRSGSGNCH